MAVDVKKVLLNLGEENAKVLIKDVLRPLAAEYIAASPNPIVHVLEPFIEMLEQALLKAADQIDGEVG